MNVLALVKRIDTTSDGTRHRFESNIGVIIIKRNLYTNFQSVKLVFTGKPKSGKKRHVPFHLDRVFFQQNADNTYLF